MWFANLNMSECDTSQHDNSVKYSFPHNPLTWAVKFIRFSHKKKRNYQRYLSCLYATCSNHSCKIVRRAAVRVPDHKTLHWTRTYRAGTHGTDHKVSLFTSRGRHVKKAELIGIWMPMRRHGFHRFWRLILLTHCSIFLFHRMFSL